MISRSLSLVIKKSGLRTKQLRDVTSLLSSQCVPSFRSVMLHQTNERWIAKATFSSHEEGSHSDFSPKRKIIPNDEDDAIKLIDEQVKNHPVMLYMKGNPSMPMCGFSSRVVQILKKEGVDFSSVNVLDYPAIREGIKKYADWPTIPQLYAHGEFIGGCDIVTSMHEAGELKEVLDPASSK